MFAWFGCLVGVCWIGVAWPGDWLVGIGWLIGVGAVGLGWAWWIGLMCWSIGSLFYNTLGSVGYAFMIFLCLGVDLGPWRGLGAPTLAAIF